MLLEENDTLLSNASNTSDIFFLLQNCISELSEGYCIFANICGYIAVSIWFFFLIPQLWKNFKTKSVAGLCVCWPTFSFSASLINIFFVFFENLPVFYKVYAIYMPVLEIMLLFQFFLYGQYKKYYREIYASICCAAWIAVIVLHAVLFIHLITEWIAISIWSAMVIPQVLYNFEKHSTAGQSNRSIALAILGSTLDFISAYLLLMPIQYLTMIYFYTTVNYSNGIQAFYYQRKRRLKPDGTKELWSKWDYYKNQFLSYIAITILFCFIIFFMVAIVWKTNSFLTLLCPFTLLTIFIAWKVFLRFRTEEPNRLTERTSEEREMNE